MGDIDELIEELIGEVLSYANNNKIVEIDKLKKKYAKKIKELNLT